jgi:hypothetical protein
VACLLEHALRRIVLVEACMIRALIDVICATFYIPGTLFMTHGVGSIHSCKSNIMGHRGFVLTLVDGRLLIVTYMPCQEWMSMYCACCIVDTFLLFM